MDDELKIALTTLVKVHTRPDPESGFLVDAKNASSVYALGPGTDECAQAWGVVLKHLGFLENEQPAS